MRWIHFETVFRRGFLKLGLFILNFCGQNESKINFWNEWRVYLANLIRLKNPISGRMLKYIPRIFVLMVKNNHFYVSLRDTLYFHKTVYLYHE
ncbi:hypothetical protein P872_00580 [Rhodonellum psychrophilum GCM71 = DSM 17998]|uniref:Uncharacterized protein n=2 Tax=Rhodonellum TaxID=336827 RepID=U5C534_9BACT|nr:hypothetical protein P872_00580 [Rhodonellum psychrophilum GCM71 = DSM 17998]SDY40120.1 hypothetical protein SAMN05444412_10138 [Rhodonellum ikkaensis]